MTLTRKFLAGSVVAAEGLGDRQIRVIASSAVVDRAGDVMVPKGAVIDGYRANPIVLADHDPSSPIGTAKVDVLADRVEALIDFAPAGISAKADEYCALAKAGVLGAVSIGFKPLESTPIKGSGGRRYDKWELMELSVVAVPCNPEALVVQRALRGGGAPEHLKVGASLNLPIVADDEIGPAAAARQILDHCGFGGDKPDSGFARKAFLAYDPGAPQEPASYSLVFAKMTDGRLTVTPSSLAAARRELAKAGLPAEIEAKARAVLQHYEAKMPAPARFVVKDLWGCAMLAETLASLGWQHARSLDEAAYEGDDSKLPAMLGEILTQIGAALVAMTREEVAELLAGRGLELPVDEIEIVELAGKPIAKSWLAARLKAGRVLSAENVEHKAAILKCMKAMSAACVKAADLHDDVHAELEAMQGHVEEATKRAKLLGAKKPKPASEPDDEDGEGDENADDADDEDPEADRELAAAAQRKREIDVLALG